MLPKRRLASLMAQAEAGFDIKFGKPGGLGGRLITMTTALHHPGSEVTHFVSGFGYTTYSKNISSQNTHQVPHALLVAVNVLKQKARVYYAMLSAHLSAVVKAQLLLRSLAMQPASPRLTTDTFKIK